MWYLVVVALTLVGELASAAPARASRSLNLGTAPVCRQVSRTYGDITCCDSCAAPLLLDTGRWVEIQQYNSAQHQGGVNFEIDVDGSGTPDAIDVGIVTDTKLAASVVSSVPCGACISSDECISNKKGVVNTWHRLCQRTAETSMAYVFGSNTDEGLTAAAMKDEPDQFDSISN